MIGSFEKASLVSAVLIVQFWCISCAELSSFLAAEPKYMNFSTLLFSDSKFPWKWLSTINDHNFISVLTFWLLWFEKKNFLITTQYWLLRNKNCFVISIISFWVAFCYRFYRFFHFSFRLCIGRSVIYNSYLLSSSHTCGLFKIKANKLTEYGQKKLNRKTYFVFWQMT